MHASCTRVCVCVCGVKVSSTVVGVFSSGTLYHIALRGIELYVCMPMVKKASYHSPIRTLDANKRVHIL